MTDSKLGANDRLLLAASIGDLPTIKALLTTPSSSDDASASTPADLAQPWYESPDLGWSALHFAAENGHTACVNYLLRNGAIWNAVDINGVTAGEVAWSGNWEKTYAALLEEGVRQTLLLSTLEQQQDLQDDEGEDEAGPSSEAKVSTDGDAQMTLTAPAGELANSNEAFLASPLRFFTDEKGKERCMDADDGLVMAGWETEIMRRSAEALCKDLPERSLVHDEDGEVRTEGFSVLNIGYGLGIIDDIFQTYKPARHVIIEPHPDAIKYFQSKEISKAQGVELAAKRWEDAFENDIATLGEFDVIYADPFAQDYKDLKQLFEHLPNFLNGPKAKFSFFHGLAGTNRFL